MVRNFMALTILGIMITTVVYGSGSADIALDSEAESSNERSQSRSDGSKSNSGSSRSNSGGMSSGGSSDSSVKSRSRYDSKTAEEESNTEKYRKTNFEISKRENEPIVSDVLMTPAYDTKIDDVTDKCIDCICQAASGCKMESNEGNLGIYTVRNFRSEGLGYGPFRITRSYWEDAGSPKADPKEKDESSFINCANNMDCARSTVKAYMARYPFDCNGDGIVNCTDYAAIHNNGPFACHNLLPSLYNERFVNCWYSPDSVSPDVRGKEKSESWFRKFLNRQTTFSYTTEGVIQTEPVTEIGETVNNVEPPDYKTERPESTTQQNEEESETQSVLEDGEKITTEIPTTDIVPENTNIYTTTEEISTTVSTTITTPTIELCTDDDKDQPGVTTEMAQETSTIPGPQMNNNYVTIQTEYPIVNEGTTPNNDNPKDYAVTSNDIVNNTTEVSPLKDNEKRTEENGAETYTEINEQNRLTEGSTVEATTEPTSKYENLKNMDSSFTTVTQNNDETTVQNVAKENEVTEPSVDTTNQNTNYEEGDKPEVDSQLPDYETKSSTDSSMAFVTASEANIETSTVSTNEYYQQTLINRSDSSIIKVTRKKRREPLKVIDISDECVHCICEAMSSCKPGYYAQPPVYGPFRITKKYWRDAGMLIPVKTNNSSFKDCVNDMDCASETVKQYMTKYKIDCNGDGLVDCDDYFAIHINGPYNCRMRPIPADYEERFLKCTENMHNLKVTTENIVLSAEDTKIQKIQNKTLTEKLMDLLGLHLF